MRQNIKFPIGIDNFQELIEQNYTFVDKSLFIKEIMNDGAKVILITRPRRFGKTINLSMLEFFLSIVAKPKKDLINNLEIAKDKAFCDFYQNKYPVIFVTFKNVVAENFIEAKKSIANIISVLYGKLRPIIYDNLNDYDKNDFDLIEKSLADDVKLSSSLERLSYFVYKATNKKSVILIDEYDTPMHVGYVNGYYDKISTLIRTMFGMALKGNDYLHKALLTGITKIAAESLFSDLNNIVNYSVLDKKYSQYFGFLENEVISLVNNLSIKIDIEKIKDWYNGYVFGDSVIYNPWSIINCLSKDGFFAPYWVNTSQNQLIKKLLDDSQSILKFKLERLLLGESLQEYLQYNIVFQLLGKSEEAFWSLFLYTGYLRAENVELTELGLSANLTIPNQEIRFIYNDIIRNWFKASLNYGGYIDFIGSLKDGNLELFENFIAEYISESGSYFDFNKNTKEQVFHSFILGLVVGLRDQYLIKSNQESGYGRFDVAFVPYDKNKNGIILEFKTSDSLNNLQDKAKEALDQIKDKKYLNIFKDHKITNVKAIGLAFFGKNVKLLFEDLSVIL